LYGEKHDKQMVLTEYEYTAKLSAIKSQTSSWRKAIYTSNLQ